MSKRKVKRKIVVGDAEYTWLYGTTCIIIRKNRAVVAKPTISEITGLNWADIERGQRKGYFHLTPKDIAIWIQKNL